jgi:hypothetical protein
MLLSTLLDLHDDGLWPTGVACSLGDSLLCERSVIHRMVRERLLAQGYRISESHTSTKVLYDCLPLFALEAMLSDRVIPAKDNVSPLRQVVSTRPNATMPLPFLVREFTKNYLLHESCHCLAHDLLFGSDSLRHWARTDPTELVLRMLLAEAFAVGTEFMAAALADPAGALFGALSSYARFSDARRRLVATSVEHLGWTGTLEAAVYVSFLAQLNLPGEAPHGVPEVALARCGVSEESSAYTQAFLPLLRDANELAPGFRTVTAPTFFTFLGVERDFLDRDFRDQVRLRLGEGHERAVHGLCAWLGEALMAEAPEVPVPSDWLESQHDAESERRAAGFALHGAAQSPLSHPTRCETPGAGA